MNTNTKCETYAHTDTHILFTGLFCTTVFQELLNVHTEITQIYAPFILFYWIVFYWTVVIAANYNNIHKYNFKIIREIRKILVGM